MVRAWADFYFGPLENLAELCETVEYPQQSQLSKPLQHIFVAYISSEIGVGIDGGAGHAELLGKVLDLLDERHDGLELLVGLAERRLELAVGVDEALDLVHCVHDEHVHEILAGAVQPVVERLQEGMRDKN